MTGAYGVPLEGEPASWSSGPVWEVDGLHGQEEDRVNEVMHFGVRHTLFADGRWMQPEPLLALNPHEMKSPRTASRTYAGGNPVLMEDRSGYSMCMLGACTYIQDHVVGPPPPTNLELQQAADAAWNAGGNHESAVFSVTYVPDGNAVLLSRNSGRRPGNKAMEAVQNVLPNAEVTEVPGDRGILPEKNHAEMAANRFAEGRRWSLDGARQAASHNACDACEAEQKAKNIINVTGTVSREGKQKRPRTTDSDPSTYEPPDEVEPEATE